MALPTRWPPSSLAAAEYRREAPAPMLHCGCGMTARVFHRVYIAAAATDVDVALAENEGAMREAGIAVRQLPGSTRRRISSWRSLRAPPALYRHLRQGRFGIARSVTLQASQPVMCTARLVQIQQRVSNFAGQVWATRPGLRYWLLKQSYRLVAASVHVDPVAGDQPHRLRYSHGLAELIRVLIAGANDFMAAALCRARAQRGCAVAVMRWAGR